MGQGHPWGGEGRLAPQSPVSRLRPVGESPTPLPSQSGVMMAISCDCPPFPDTVLSLPQMSPPGCKHLESTLCRPSGWGPCKVHMRSEESCVLAMGLADAQLSLGPPHFQAHLPSFQPQTYSLSTCVWQAREQLPTPKSTLGAPALLKLTGPLRPGPSSGLWAAPQQGLPTLSPPPLRPPSTAEPSGSSSSPKLSPSPQSPSFPTPPASYGVTG